MYGVVIFTTEAHSKQRLHREEGDSSGAQRQSVLIVGAGDDQINAAVERAAFGRRVIGDGTFVRIPGDGKSR